MITAIVKWRAEPGIRREDLIERVRGSIPVYLGREGLVRKYICFDLENACGLGIYLWRDRESAEKFYEFAAPIIEAESGAPPEIRLYDTPIVVENTTGAVEIDD